VVHRLVIKITKLFETRRFIITFSKTRHTPLVWASSVHYATSEPISLKSEIFFRTLDMKTDVTDDNMSSWIIFVTDGFVWDTLRSRRNIWLPKRKSWLCSVVGVLLRHGESPKILCCVKYRGEQFKFSQLLCFSWNYLRIKNLRTITERMCQQRHVWWCYVRSLLF
jgi:hypothetical protein